MFAEIRTERLAIRDLKIGDARTIFEYRSHPDVSRFQSWGTQSPEEIQAYIRDQPAIEPGIAGPWYQLGIVLLSEHKLIGDCGFHVFEHDPGQAEIGIALAPESQGHGYATEALSALLDYLLVKLRKDRVLGSVDPRNVRSARLMERVGMRKEAHVEKTLWFKGEWVDDVIFTMIGSDYQSGRLGV